MKANRTRHPKVFCKSDVLTNLAKLPRKHPWILVGPIFSKVSTGVTLVFAKSFRAVKPRNVSEQSLFI